jgi:hypothetical protein
MASSNTIDRSAFEFFHEHAGYIVGRRAIGAAELARAEAWLNEQDDLEVVWKDDPYPDLSWLPDGETVQTVEVCRIEREPYACHCCGQTVQEVLTSLSGITDADDNYRRVVAAELAAELRQND